MAVAGAIFFLMAVALAAAPALKGGVAGLGGLLLLVGLAGVAFIGLIALRAYRQDGSSESEAAAVLAALDEPAAVVERDGAIAEANVAWRRLVGGSRRSPRDPGLHMALRQARPGAATRARIMVNGKETTLSITVLDSGQFLLRAAPAQRTAATAAVEALEPLASASPFGAALIDGADPFDGEIREANTALAAIAGPGAAPGARLADLIAMPAVAETREAIGRGRPGPYEVALAEEPQRAAELWLTRFAGGWYAHLVEITQQKELQRQLNQRNKMEAIGQLAGGVAHDFNNLLSAMRLRVDELLLRHSLGDPSFDSLTEIRDTIVRAADLVNQLLTFSRKATVQREVLDLGETLGALEVLLRRLLRENIALETGYGRDLPHIRVDRAQLDNAIVNLVVNARDAIKTAGRGGAVSLLASRVAEEEARSLGYEGPAMGEMAMIEVADDGPGIPPELIGKIFEPFFTTKGVGEGTGLGLATVYGIVKQAEGWIAVRSAPGDGTRFRIFLPAYVEPVRVEPVARPPVRPARPRDLSGAGRILFVEDEASVRGIAARLLRARGYEVLEAADGLEALELARSNAGAIDLMISDVIMPGMDGPTLLREARQYLGAAPVMFISGYAEAEFSATLEGESGVSFLPKPIDIRTLSERVKQQLQAA